MGRATERMYRAYQKPVEHHMALFQAIIETLTSSYMESSIDAAKLTTQNPSTQSTVREVPWRTTINISGFMLNAMEEILEDASNTYVAFDPPKAASMDGSNPSCMRYPPAGTSFCGIIAHPQMVSQDFEDISLQICRDQM